jgi:hypothetical protein
VSQLTSTFYKDFETFKEISAYTLLSTRPSDHEENRVKSVVNGFLDAINGMPRGEIVVAMLTLMHLFVDNWREEEELMSRPVV